MNKFYNYLTAITNGGTKKFLFLDYDGTLVPIAARPDLAKPGYDVLQTLRELAEINKYKIAIVSGRSIEDIRKLLPIDQLFFIGNHGAEYYTPHGYGKSPLVTSSIRETLSSIAERLKTETTKIEGILIEHKKYGVALHYRRSTLVNAERAIQIFLKIGNQAIQEGQLMWQPGKKVLELKPFGIDKGKSIKNFIKAYSNVNKQHIYIGDDYTDETAFSFLRSNGISILVSKTQEKSYAKYRLRSSEDVLNFLKSIIRMHT